MRLFDTHVHLEDEKFDGCRDQVIKNMVTANVVGCIDVCCNLDKTEIAIQLVNDNPQIYAAYGMHPHYVGRMTDKHVKQLYELLKTPKCVALGEIGLDYHYDFSDRESQRLWFDKQLYIAEECNLPVILHIREAFGDCMDILSSHKNRLKGVMHCCSGSYEIAKRCIDMGLHIAFGGSVTFNNATNLRDVAKRLPMDSLLIETDCPYMTPVPYRGKTNEPQYVSLVAERIAQLHNINVEDLAFITYNNAVELFSIKE